MAMLVITRKFQDLKDRDAEGFFSNRGIYHNVFFGCLALWFYAWWFGLWFVELARAFPRDYPGRFFLFASASALAGFALSRLLRCKSLLLGAVPSMAFALGFLLYVIFSRTAGFWNTPALIPSYNFFQGLYRWGWPAFFVSQGLIAAPAKKDVHEALRGTWTFILILTASAVLASSGRALTLRFNLAPSWRSFAGLLPLFAAVGALSALSGKGFSKSLGETTKRLLFFVLPLIFCAVLGLWFVVTLFLSGNPSPLPLYIPLINPLDLLEAFSVLIFLYWQASLGKSGAKEALSRGVLFVIGDIAVFLFVTALLARSMHFYGNIPYGSLFGSDTFQLGLFILWALCGIAHIIAGTRLAFRRIWIAGAALTVVDIAKLLLLDLAAAGAPVRIVSFFAAGLILLFIGWVSPLPPSRKEP
jgi:uncharacterized membrane protein